MMSGRALDMKTKASRKSLSWQQEQAVQHYLCCGYRLTQAVLSTSEA